MSTYITNTLDEHIICSQHPDTQEVIKQCEEIEHRRVVAAAFHGIQELTKRKIRLTLCDECIDALESKLHN